MVLPLLSETQSALVELCATIAAAVVATTLLDQTKTAHRALMFGIAFVLAVRYILWRATSTLAPLGMTVDFAASGSLFVFEAAALVGSLSAFVMLTRTRSRSAEASANLNWWAPGPPPKVAILIATYNETQDVLERTVVGAMALRHPNKEILVLDDGRRDWLRAYCHRMGVRYVTRPDNHGAKAGNMNHALALLDTDAERPDFVAVLDADFVPHRGFISRTLALFHDPAVGLVQTPQHFFNADPIQHNLGLSRSYPDEQRFFFDHMQAARDAWGIAFCCGTSSVARFAALKQIGWFSTESVTEDFMVTLVLQNAGWKTVYLNEALTEGLAPEGLKEYVTQRARWCLGMMQIARSEVGPLTKNRLRPRDRWSVIDSVLYWTTTFPFRLAALIYPLFYWFASVTVVDATVPDVIRYFGSYYVWVLIALNFVTLGVVMPILTDVSQLLGAIPISRAAFVGLVRPKGHPFRVTAKGGDRSRVIVQWALLAPFAIVLGLTLCGLIVGILSDRFAFYDAGDGKAIVLFWTIYNVVVLSFTILICVELPRRERHVADVPEQAELLQDGQGPQSVWLVGLTQDRVRIRGVDCAPGSQGILRIAGIGDVAYLALSSTSDGARLFLNPDELQHRALLERFYTDGDAPGVLNIRLAALIEGISRRLSFNAGSR